MHLSALLYMGEGTNAESRQDLKSMLAGYLTERSKGGGFTIDETSDGAEFRDPGRLLPYRLIAFPGGFDLGFIRCLGESGMANLRRHVTSGRCGYLGICAGAYFACRQIEFARGDPQLEVVGSRLGFYSGCGLGPVFPGFDYKSLAGARAAKIDCCNDGLTQRVHMYFNGGAKFVNDSPPAADPSTSARCLAVYTEPGARGDAAVVLARCGAGAALLFGAHPEMSKAQLRHSEDDRLRGIADRLREDSELRRRITHRMLDQLMDIVDQFWRSAVAQEGEPSC